MATAGEVDDAVATLRAAGCEDLTLLHCVSAYPTPSASVNLAAIATIRDRTGCRTGWSDHTTDPAVIERAVHRWGAAFVELHMDIEGMGAEFGPGHCWLADDVAILLARIRRGLDADGDGQKVPASEELPDRDWRADPEDGLRPLRRIRKSLLSD
jgi:sialic acid synthase SpsE